MHPVEVKTTAIASNPLIFAKRFISASFTNTKCCLELTLTRFHVRPMKLQRPFQNRPDTGGGNLEVFSKAQAAGH